MWIKILLLYKSNLAAPNNYKINNVQVVNSFSFITRVELPE